MRKVNDMNLFSNKNECIEFIKRMLGINDNKTCVKMMFNNLIDIYFKDEKPTTSEICDMIAYAMLTETHADVIELMTVMNKISYFSYVTNEMRRLVKFINCIHNKHELILNEITKKVCCETHISLDAAIWQLANDIADIVTILIEYKENRSNADNDFVIDVCVKIANQLNSPNMPKTMKSVVYDLIESVMPDDELNVYDNIAILYDLKKRISR